MAKWWLVGMLFILLFMTSCYSGQEIDVNETFRNYRDTSEYVRLREERMANQTPVFDEKGVELEEISYTPITDKEFVIGSYYVTNFNLQKAQNDNIMLLFQETLQTYDILVIQGLRSPYTETASILAESLGKNYQLSKDINERREAHVILHSNDVRYKRKETLKSSDFYNDIFVVELVKNNYTYVIASVEVHPPNAQSELLKLGSLITQIEKTFRNKNIILMGNFYSDCVFFQGERPKGMVWLIDTNTTTSSVSDCTYDNIITRLNYGYRIIECGSITHEDFGVDRLDYARGISRHYPIYCKVDV